MKATISLILATIFWGLNFHFAKFMLSESTFIESGAWRYIFGVVILILILVPSFKNDSFNKIPLKGVLLVGAIGLFGFNIFFFSGMQYTSALNAALIASLNPATTLLLSALILKTKIRSYHIIGATISLIGVLILLTQGSIDNLLNIKFNIGDLLIFGANLVFGLHHVWVKMYAGKISNLQFTAYTNVICLLGFILISFFLPAKIHIDHTTNYWLLSIGIGVFGTAIAYLLWNKGVSEIGADKAGMYMNMVPLTAAIFSLFLGLKIQTFHIISGIIIIAGISLTQISSYVKLKD